MPVPAHSTHARMVCRTTRVSTVVAMALGAAPRVTLSRNARERPAGEQPVATLTYVYADSVAVLGPLATYAEAHSYDLCESHADD